ncbi:hypothetical protein QJS04_geneDACA003701 [Acorus gramineus]|uniref:Uncharacterized protein n=1 Tax=Acorus gramineus TaxID=55184 RepID=A0AAV9BQF4_ACOGR|nr:hypothetical protein QJS04_geneDACA003701 [Acorus gramineus]
MSADSASAPDPFSPSKSSIPAKSTSSSSSRVPPVANHNPRRAVSDLSPTRPSPRRGWRGSCSPSAPSPTCHSTPPPPGGSPSRSRWRRRRWRRGPAEGEAAQGESPSLPSPPPATPLTTLCSASSHWRQPSRASLD